MNHRRLPSLLVMLLASCLLFSCGGSDTAPQIEVVAAPTDPDVMLVVNGEPITKSDIARSMRFHELAYPDAPELRWTKLALENDLILLAAVKAHYKPLLAVKFAEMEGQKKQIHDTASFRRVAAEYVFQNPDQHNKTGAWQVPGDFRLSTQGLALVDTPKGEVSDPFMTLTGIHILFVEDRLTIGAPHEHKARISQLMYRFEPPAQLAAALESIQKNIYVSWVHPDYEAFVPPGYRIRPTTGG